MLIRGFVVFAAPPANGSPAYFIWVACFSFFILFSFFQGRSRESVGKFSSFESNTASVQALCSRNVQKKEKKKKKKWVFGSLRLFLGLVK